MSATELLRQAQAEGLQLTITGRTTLKVTGDQAAIDRWVPKIKANKPALIELLNSRAALELRRDEVVNQLEECPEIRVAFDVQRASMQPELGESVSVMLAIRTATAGIVSAEFSIPREKFDIALFTKTLDETSRRPS